MRLNYDARLGETELSAKLDLRNRMNIVINGKVCTVVDDDAMLIDVVRSGGLPAPNSFAAAVFVAPAQSYSTASRWSAVSCPPRPRATGK